MLLAQPCPLADVKSLNPYLFLSPIIYIGMKFDPSVFAVLFFSSVCGVECGHFVLCYVHIFVTSTNTLQNASIAHSGQVFSSTQKSFPDTIETYNDTKFEE